MYNFTDTTEQAGKNSLPAEALQINGEYIENLIEGYRTLYATGRELNETEISEIQIGDADGTDYHGRRLVPRVLTVGYQLLSKSPEAFREKFNELCRVLNQEQAKLIFYDEPDKYYIGTKSEVGEVESGKLNVTGEFTFYCCDPYKYAVAEKTFKAEVNSSGILEATITNEGNADADINYTIKHNHENGYIGIVSDKGALQFGKIEEADGVNYKTNELLTTLESFYNIPDDHGKNVLHPNYGTGGTLSHSVINGRKCMYIQTMGDFSPGVWTGGMRTLTIPADSNGEAGAVNFYCYLNYWWQTGLVGQTAQTSISFLTADNKLICAYNIFKNDKVGNTAIFEFWANRKLKQLKFTPDDRINMNMFIESSGHADIRKEGDKLTFYWFGSYPSYVIPEIKDMKCAKIQIAIEQYAGRNLSNQYVTRNYIREINFQKMGVSKWRDVPNRYASGDILFIDGREKKPYLNGMPVQRDEIVGTKYFKAPPGESKVEFYYSTFCNPRPTVEVSIRERWL